MKIKLVILDRNAMSESGGVVLQLENMVMWEKKEVNIFIINSNKAKYWAPFVNYGSGCSFYFHGPVNLLPLRGDFFQSEEQCAGKFIQDKNEFYKMETEK